MRTWRRRRMRASFSTHTRKNRRRRKIIILCTLGGKWNPWIHLCYSINFKKKTWFIFVSFGYLRRPCCRAERGCTTMFGARFTLHIFIYIFFRRPCLRLGSGAEDHRGVELWNPQRQLSCNRRCAAAHIFMPPGDSCEMWTNGKFFKVFSLSLFRTEVGIFQIYGQGSA